jgi:hypothetical protein
VLQICTGELKLMKVRWFVELWPQKFGNFGIFLRQIRFWKISKFSLVKKCIFIRSPFIYRYYLITILSFCRYHNKTPNLLIFVILDFLEKITWNLLGFFPWKTYESEMEILRNWFVKFLCHLRVGQKKTGLFFKFGFWNLVIVHINYFRNFRVFSG